MREKLSWLARAHSARSRSLRRSRSFLHPGQLEVTACTQRCHAHDALTTEAMICQGGGGRESESEMER